MHDANNITKNAELRRKISASAVTSIVMVGIIGLLSLFSVWSVNRSWQAGMQEKAVLQNMVRSALEAEIHFKMQVQEWKNILLRSGNSQSFEQHFERFNANAILTEKRLRSVADTAEAKTLADISRKAGQLIDDHQKLQDRYLAEITHGRELLRVIPMERALEIDRRLKGIDRKFDTDIEALAVEILTLSNDLERDTNARMQNRYDALHYFIIVSIIVSICISAITASLALRATRA